MPSAAVSQGVCVLALIGLFLLWGWRRPRVARPVWVPDTWVNLVTGGSLFLFRALCMAGLMEWAAAPSRPRLVDLGGLTEPALQFTVAFVLQDFARYALHYAHHRVPWLWRFHAVHHSSEHLNSTSGLRMHLVDFIQLNLVPVVLFGVVFDASGFHPGVWLAISLVVHGMDAWQHGNIRMDMRSRWARWWDTMLVNPCFHSWHHARDWRKYNGNYGQSLSIWDHLFGTYVSEPDPCLELGLSEAHRLENSPLGLQLLRPVPPPREGGQEGEGQGEG